MGTGTFDYQLAFYQRHGFCVTSIDHDFFVKNYPEPIFEDGIQLVDMLRLSLRYSSKAHEGQTPVPRRGQEALP